MKEGKGLEPIVFVGDVLWVDAVHPRARREGQREAENTNEGTKYKWAEMNHFFCLELMTTLLVGSLISLVLLFFCRQRGNSLRFLLFLFE